MGANPSVKAVCLDGGTGLPLCASHEEYEASVPRLGNKLRLGKEQDVWLVLSGAGKVSGAVLAVLEQIKNRRVRVAYVYPDPILLSKTQTLQNRLVYNVLQEYARSGMIDSLYLFSNNEIEKVVGASSLDSMYEKINHTISTFLVTLNWFEKSEPLVGNLHEPKETSRIRTVGVGKIGDPKEDLYFPLENETECAYYYSISEETKKSEKNLLTNIRECVILYKEREIECSFGLWENQSDISFFYTIRYTHYIQREVI